MDQSSEEPAVAALPCRSCGEGVAPTASPEANQRHSARGAGTGKHPETGGADVGVPIFDDDAPTIPIHLPGGVGCLRRCHAYDEAGENLPRSIDGNDVTWTRIEAPEGAI